MFGPETVAIRVAEYLRTTMPMIVQRLADELGEPAPDSDPPGVPPLDAMPQLFASTQIAVRDVGLDDWPFVIVMGLAMRSLRRTDVAPDGTITYTCTYPVRVFYWARGDGFHATARVRDRMVLAGREALLVDPSLGDPRFLVQHVTMVERYSDVDEDEAPNSELATVAVASADFDVIVDEPLTPLVPGGPPVTGLDLDTQVLPRHPAL